MRSVICWLVFMAGSTFLWAGERLIDFSKYPLDQAPAGFRDVVSGGGPPAEWKVIAEPAPGDSAARTDAVGAAPRAVLAQLSRDSTDERFPMLIFDEESYGDFAVTTRFKIVDGVTEQMAGLAFRVQDTNNYYYVRASALGSTFRFIKLVNGQRLTTIGPSIEIEKGVWHELSVDCKGNRIAVLFDGKELIPPMTDNTFTAGKIAYWTKSDSVAYFGDTKITFTPHETLAQVLVRETMRRYPRLVGVKVFALQGSDSLPKIVASTYDDELGRPGTRVEQDVITRDVLYQGRDKNCALVTMPLHDRNGDVAGAVRVVLQSFPGQTEQNALARAQPIVREMEQRIRMAKDLLQ